MNRAYLLLLSLCLLVACQAPLASTAAKQLAAKPVADETSQAACTGADGSWHCPGMAQRIVRAAIPSGSSATTPAAWNVSAWYIDPANAVSGACASDTNNCTSATCGAAGSSVGPCISAGQIIRQRWGTPSPTLAQTTTFTWLSSQSGDTDPVVVSPLMTNGGVFIKQGQLTSAQQIQTGTITVVNARNRATPQQLVVTFGAGLTAGQIVNNTTHSSFAFLIQNTAGNNWKVSQPTAPVGSVPTAGFSPPAEVNNWTTGDSYVVYQLTTANIVSMLPTAEKNNAGLSAVEVMYHLEAKGATGNPGLVPVLTNPWVEISESAFSTRELSMIGPTGQSGNGAFWINDYFGKGIFQTVSSNNGANEEPVQVIGGVIAGPGGRWASALFDQDVDWTATNGLFTGGGLIGIGTMSLDPGGQWQTSIPVKIASVYAGSAIVWGGNIVMAIGTGRINYPAGAGAAATTFPANSASAPLLRINQGSLACLGVPSVATPVFTCNKTVTAANLDTDLGGTSGCYFTEGGGSICNYGP